jgi:hypothetical protein
VELLEYRSRNFIVIGGAQKKTRLKVGYATPNENRKSVRCTGKIEPADDIFSYKIPPRGVECERTE